jgi:succinylglutamate desuccinylase
MNNFAVVVCLHGNELVGLHVKESMGKEGVKFIIGNLKAIEKNTRYIDSDLNRSFPGSQFGGYEEKRAAEILKEVSGFENVVDIHSSECNMGLFGIITKPNKEKINLAKRLSLKKVVIMSEDLAKGGALIDYHKCGISLEIGPHRDIEKNAEEIIKSIKSLHEEKGIESEPEFYFVFDLIKGDNIKDYHVENFQEVKKGQIVAEGEIKHYAEHGFFPIFAGEKAYDGIICLAAKKIRESNII